MTDKDTQSQLADQEEAIEVEAQDYIQSRSTGHGTYSTDNQQQASKPKGAKTGLLWLISVLNLILILAAAAGGYWFYQQWHADKQQQTDFFSNQSQELQNQRVANDKVTERLNQQSTQVEQQSAQLVQQLESVKQNLATLEAQAQSNKQSLAEMSGRRPSDWLLAEADYLVTMAGRKLWLEHDVKTAVLMLQAADSRLQDLSDPSLITLRQQISVDIQTLQQINKVSLTSVALALSGMLPQIDNLSLALPKVELNETPAEQLSGFDRFWAYLKSNFQYQPNNQPITPLLSQQQQWLVREQLKYALMQAQSAVMAEQSTLYTQSLQRALGIVVSHFDLSDGSVAQFVDGINNLQNTNIQRQYPDRLGSAQPLKDILENRMSQVYSNSEGAPL